MDGDADYSLLEAAEARSEVLQEVLDLLQQERSSLTQPYIWGAGLDRAIHLVQEMNQ